MRQLFTKRRIGFFRKLLPVIIMGLLCLQGKAQLIKDTINIYTAVISISGCEGKIGVEDAAGFNTGDKVLLIKMKGASVNTSTSYGDVRNMNNVGLMEFGKVKSVSGNTISLENGIIGDYGTPTVGYVQLIRVMSGTHLVTDGIIRARAWNGKSGGVVVISACKLTLKHPIIVDTCGFRGGRKYDAPASTSGPGWCSSSSIRGIFNNDWGANKGEGIGSPDSWGRLDNHGSCYGRFANGGGGGNNHNAGGGGGGNAGYGGQGGNIYSGCIVGNASHPGQGGRSVSGGLFMGGGGGAGHCNNNGLSRGGNGGGIIIIELTDSLINNGGSLSAKGESIYDIAVNDAAGGGGAGGSISIYTPAYAGIGLNCNVQGGGGGSVSDAVASFGPGGGGSGGVVQHSPALNGLIFTGGTINFSGWDSKSNSKWGATDGAQPVIIPIADLSILVPRGKTPTCPDFPVKEFTICPGQTLPICDTAPERTLSADLIGYEQGARKSFPPLPLPTAPQCTPVTENIPLKIICKTFKDIRESGFITAEYRMENGCKCYRKYKITVLQPQINTVVLNVNCGDSIDLNNYRCGGPLVGTGWRDSTNNAFLLYAKIKAAPGVYTQDFYTTNADPCLTCRTRVVVNVIPYPPYPPMTVYGCENQPLTISAFPISLAGTTFVWTYPGGPRVTGLPGVITVPAAHNGDVYQLYVFHPNGCRQDMTITVSTVVPKIFNRTVNIYCGDSINLDTLDLCGNNGQLWRKNSTGTMVPGRMTLNASTTFTRNTYAVSGTTTCLSCVMNITVNVLPIPPKNITFVACENQPIPINGDCYGINTWQWTGPNNTPIPQNTQTIIVMAHHNDQYRVITTSPYGCVCTTYVKIITSPIPNNPLTVNVYCGDTINLDTVGKCIGYSQGWKRMPTNTPVSNKVVPTVTTTYRRITYTDPSMTCSNCSEDITVNVLPKPVENITLEVYACQNIVLHFPCAGSGAQYRLIGPGGTQMFFPPMTFIPVATPTTPTTYTIETTLPNGCICRRIYAIKPLTPVVKKKYIYVTCGDSLNLDTVAGLCPAVSEYWGDATGLAVNKKMKMLGEEKTFYKYALGGSGCVECKTELTVIPINPPAVIKRDTIPCSDDGLWIHPDCEGEVYEWSDTAGFQRTVYGGNGEIYVSRIKANRTYKVVTTTADGCLCITYITVDAFLNPDFTTIDVEVECGDSVDLNEYDICDTVPGLHSNWKRLYGDTLTSPKFATYSGLGGSNYVKEVLDQNGCIKCRVFVRLAVTNHNWSYVNREDSFEVCKGALVDPPPMCPGAFSYDWYDEMGIVKIGTGSALLADSTKSRISLRYGYNEKGCLICVERVKIFTYDPISEGQIDTMPFSQVNIACPGIMCERRSPNPTYHVNFGPGVTCIWDEPTIVSDAPDNDITICPPFTPGAYVRRCYNEDSCLIYAFKIQLDTISCEPNGKTYRGNDRGLPIESYTLYPNPTQGGFQVDRSISEGDATVTVYDAIGQLIFTGIIHDGERSATFSLENHAAGVYMVSITSLKGEVYRYKLLRE